MSRYLIGLITVALLIGLSATPAAAHGFLLVNAGNSLPTVGGLLDLGESTSFFFSAEFESGTGVDDSWDIVTGLRLYANDTHCRPYWGIYGFSERRNAPMPFSGHGLNGVYGWEWRYGDFFQICAFTEAGLELAWENGEFVCEPAYGIGVGVSLWVY